MPLSDALAAKLTQFVADIENKANDFMGYPVNTEFDYSPLWPLMKYPLNNLGDPFATSTWKVDSREFECEVIHFFADLFRAPKNDFWGYVTNGGTEANLYALYLARELYPQGRCYFSADTHYSVAKNLRLLNMPCQQVKSDAKGEIDYQDLALHMQSHAHLPAIVFANSGTTMTEAKDDVSKIKQICLQLSSKAHYIHSDAALSGATNPFMDPKPAFDFADGADSISMSGHKFIGSPIPCGVILAKRSNVERISSDISYIGCPDNTITGSRNGFTPMVLWYAIHTLGVDGLAAKVKACVAIADYAIEQLQAIGIPAWRHSSAITVVFPQVPEAIKQKYQLATAQGITHIVCMPRIQKQQIDALVAALQASAS
jgi:histidine decarboxylase